MYKSLQKSILITIEKIMTIIRLKCFKTSFSEQHFPVHIICEVLYIKILDKNVMREMEFHIE